MIESIVIAFLLARFKGHKIKPILTSWPFIPIIVLSLLYVLLEIFVFNGNYFFLKYTHVIKFINLVAFTFLIIKYNQIIYGFIGVSFLIFGSILNNIVIAANGDKMPVFPTLSLLTGYIKKDTFNIANDGLHILGNELTKLKILSDIFDVGYCVMSIGDISIRLFALITVYSVTVEANKRYIQMIKK